MTGFFFVVDPVWWIGTLHLTSVWIGLSIGLIVWLGLWYRDRLRRTIQTEQREAYRYNTIDPNIDNYAGLTLIEIRRYLAYIYPPQHSWAHIPSQIATYTKDQSLIDIIRKLEQTEYTQKELIQEEKEEINRELSMRLGKQ